MVARRALLDGRPTQNEEPGCSQMVHIETLLHPKIVARSFAQKLAWRRVVCRRAYDARMRGDEFSGRDKARSL